MHSSLSDPSPLPSPPAATGSLAVSPAASPVAHRRPARAGIVAPTFNNAHTLASVIEPLLQQDIDVIVVNDGSRDETANVLDTLKHHPRLHVVTHEHNRGKASALRSGFDHARNLGLTHVLTIDTDGQHDVADVPALWALAVDHPDAIVVGTRQVTKDYPWKSWIGRGLSNALVWAIGGVCVTDSQSGLRVYPLEIVRELGAVTSRYAFETEILARAGWAGVPVRQVPIRCIYQVAGGRISHFRPWMDSLSAVNMHARLLTCSCLPWTARHASATLQTAASGPCGTIAARFGRWMNPLRTWRQVRVDPAERERVAASVGWGVVMGFSPLFGLKTLICLVLSKVFRLQPLVVMGTSSLASPPMGAVVWAFSIAVGHMMVHGERISLDRYNFSAGQGAVFKQVAFEWLLGGTLCGALFGTLAWLIVRAAGRRVPLRSRNPLQQMSVEPE